MGFCVQVAGMVAALMAMVVTMALGFLLAPLPKVTLPAKHKKPIDTRKKCMALLQTLLLGRI